MDYFKIRNFERFQHYKDRRPPWIKLWFSLLGDYEFSVLPDETKYHLIALFLIASQHENRIPADMKWLQAQIGTSKRINLDLLYGSGFIEPCAESYAENRCNWASRYVSAQEKERILRRDSHKCVACGSTDHLEIDHILPISKGGKSEWNNLQTLCRKCNRMKRFKLPAQNNSYADAQKASSASGETESEKESEAETEKTPKSPKGTLCETGKTCNGKFDECHKAFDLIWKEYPRHVPGKTECLKAWCKQFHANQKVETIVAYIRRAKPGWKDIKFVPHLTKFLNQRYWEGDLPFAGDDVDQYEHYKREETK